MSSPIRASALLFRNTSTNAQLKKLRGRIDKVTDAAVSGLEVKKASDAPGSWPHVHELTDSIADQEVYGANADRALSMLGVADTALRDSSSVMKRAREISVRFSTGSMNAEDRASAAAEVDGLRASLLDLANTDVAGRHIFAGTRYDQAAFDATGAYVGSADRPEIAIGKDGETLAAGWDGSTVFGTSLTALDDLANTLRTGTAADVHDEIDVVDAAMRDIIEARSVAGSEFNRAEDVKVLTESMSIVLNEGLANEVAADPFETFQHFTELAQHMEATLQLTARSNSMQGLFSRI